MKEIIIASGNKGKIKNNIIDAQGILRKYSVHLFYRS